MGETLHATVLPPLSLPRVPRGRKGTGQVGSPPRPMGAGARGRKEYQGKSTCKVNFPML
jgi:hypothetical protein